MQRLIRQQTVDYAKHYADQPLIVGSLSHQYAGGVDLERSEVGSYRRPEYLWMMRDMKGKEGPRDTRVVILHAALDLLGDLGFSGVTLGGLARKVGMSKSGLFAHFRSIEQLHLALIEHTAELLRMVVLIPANQAPNGLPRLEVTMARWLDTISTSGNLGGCPLIAGLFEFDDRPGAVRESLFIHETEWRQHLKDLVENTISTGHFRKDLDSSQFLSDLCGIYYSFHVSARFLRASDASDRAVVSMRSLIQRSR